MELQKIWVICIGYDYGVWTEAGFFLSEDDAKEWIAKEHAKENKEHQEFIVTYPQFKGSTAQLTQFYTVEIELASKI